jgi:hypothetical protein
VQSYNRRTVCPGSPRGIADGRDRARNSRKAFENLPRTQPSCRRHLARKQTERTI